MVYVRIFPGVPARGEFPLKLKTLGTHVVDGVAVGVAVGAGGGVGVGVGVGVREAVRVKVTTTTL
jgi:hypothetical protein